MSDTPRTDAVRWTDSESECDVVSAEFARQLERELNEAKELIQELRDEVYRLRFESDDEYEK